MTDKAKPAGKTGSGEEAAMTARGWPAKAAFTADYRSAIVRPSPNFGERAAGKTVTMLIMHFTGMESAEAAERHLTDPQSQVSAHYLLREDGAVVQMVAEAKRAWHAGQSFWRGERDINSCSIGIELVNKGNIGGFPPYPQAQINSLIALAKDIIARRKLLPHNILGHSDIAPARKIDPGAAFPWGELARAGIGCAVPPAPIKEGQIIGLGASGRPVEAFQSMLALYGYDIAVTGVFDAQTQQVTKAFQRHFRPQKIDGAADISTLAALRSLLAAA